MDRMFRTVMMLVCTAIVLQCLAGCATSVQERPIVSANVVTSEASEARQEPAQRFSWTHTGRMRQTAMVGQ